MKESNPVDLPLPGPLLRSPRGVRRKGGTLLAAVVGRALTLPVLVGCLLLVGMVVLEPVLVFLIPGEAARVVARWGEFEARRGYTYHVRYRFDGSGYVGSDEVMPEEYAAMAAGQPVRAHLVHIGALGYAALDRSARAYARYRRIDWFGALFAAAIGGVLYYGFWLAPWRTHWLTRHGKATFGAVVEKRVIQTTRRHQSFTLTYQFKAMGRLRSRRISVNDRRYDSAGVKDLVVVLFDPARPGRNIVYDYCDFVAE